MSITTGLLRSEVADRALVIRPDFGRDLVRCLLKRVLDDFLPPMARPCLGIQLQPSPPLTVLAQGKPLVLMLP